MVATLQFLPIVPDGEGAHAKHGGGVAGGAVMRPSYPDAVSANYPSTTLRVVPLPIGDDGEEQARPSC
jgi:hypothetical protein